MEFAVNTLLTTLAVVVLIYPIARVVERINTIRLTNKVSKIINDRYASDIQAVKNIMEQIASSDDAESLLKLAYSTTRDQRNMIFAIAPHVLMLQDPKKLTTTIHNALIAYLYEKEKSEGNLNAVMKSGKKMHRIVNAIRDFWFVAVQVLAVFALGLSLVLVIL